MRLIILSILLGSSVVLFSQTKPIIAAEYFLDNFDPGFGSATPIPVLNPSETLLLDFEVPTDGLAAGFHQIDVRVKRDSAWSGSHRRTFYIRDSVLEKSSTYDITEAEYFFDHLDPGRGQGNSLQIPVTGQAVELSDSIDLSSLDPGFHIIETRVKRSDGAWSDTDWRFFHIADTAGADKLIRLEYEIKQGATILSNSTIAIAPAQHQAKITFDAPTDVLTAGLYEICVVAVDEKQQESSSACRVFQVTGGGGGTPIDDEQTSDFVVFPNPTTGPLTIKSAAQPIISYQLSDAHGRLLLREEPLPGTREAVLSLTQYPRGVYFVAIEVAGEVRVKMVEVR